MRHFIADSVGRDAVSGRWQSTLSLRERIEQAIERVTESGCWIWQGRLSKEGYGRITLRPGHRSGLAHVVAYEEYVGPSIEGLEVDHKCRVRCCVNPWHLELVTHRVNVRRGASPIAHNARKTHCENGHPLVGDNLRERPDGNGSKRDCRTCQREFGRRSDLKRSGTQKRRDSHNAACQRYNARRSRRICA